MAITTNNLISRQTVGSANATSISFTNIPQTFTDLKIVVSTRSTSAAAYDVFGLTLNTSGSGFTNISLYGNGASGNVYSEADTTFTAGDVYGRVITAATPTSSQTASVFSSFELYIPNYTGGGKKTVSIDAVAETNAATSYGVGFDAALSPSVGAVTEMGFKLKDGSFVQYSTFSLYGISSNTSTQNTSVPSATGGDVITTDGTYWYHAFKASGTFTPLKALTADYLVVAGGGGGGWAHAAGGAAGGLRSATAQSLTTTTYTVTVGAGGTTGSGYGATSKGTNGSDSVFNSLTSTGGGAGGGSANGAWSSGNTGGSGGGGSYSLGSGYGYAGAGNTPSTSPSQGNTGGQGSTGPASGGGGGGAGAVGSTGAPGAGGVGSSAFSSWGLATGTGQLVSGTYYYAGGGGGGVENATGAAGGYGGGGAGVGTTGATGTAGTANTGGGGGGGGYSTHPGGPGGTGGSGIVIMRYLA